MHNEKQHFKTDSLITVPWRTKTLIPLMWRRHFPLRKFCNATITFLFFLALFHSLPLASCKVVLFCSFGYSCCIFCCSLRSVLFVVTMCKDADHSYSLFPGLPLTPSHLCALTLYRVFGWKPEQSLDILSVQSLWCTLITLLLLCCGCKCTPESAEFCSGPVPAARCRRQKRDTVTLWCHADGTTWLWLSG